MPCFLWIFLGAPYVEGLSANDRLSAALTAITAAVVGVIANLALFFAVHTCFGEVDDGHRCGPVHLDVPDWSSLGLRAVAVTAAAAWLLFRRKWSVLRTLGACAALGAASTSLPTCRRPTKAVPAPTAQRDARGFARGPRAATCTPSRPRRGSTGGLPQARSRWSGHRRRRHGEPWWAADRRGPGHGSRRVECALANVVQA